MKLPNQFKPSAGYPSLAEKYFPGCEYEYVSSQYGYTLIISVPSVPLGLKPRGQLLDQLKRQQKLRALRVLDLLKREAREREYYGSDYKLKFV